MDVTYTKSVKCQTLAIASIAGNGKGLEFLSNLYGFKMLCKESSRQVWGVPTSSVYAHEEDTLKKWSSHKWEEGICYTGMQDRCDIG